MHFLWVECSSQHSETLAFRHDVNTKTSTCPCFSFSVRVNKYQMSSCQVQSPSCGLSVTEAIEQFHSVHLDAANSITSTISNNQSSKNYLTSNRCFTMIDFFRTTYRLYRTVYGQNGDKSKRRHRNGDRNGYIQKSNNPKQHLCSSIEAYIIDRRLYTYMTYNC